MTVKKFTINVCIFIMFFSWSSMRLNSFDSQVWPLIAAIIIILCVGKIQFPIVNRELALILFLLGLVWSVMVSQGKVFYIFRSLFGYITFFMVFIAIYEVYTRKITDIYKVAFSANIVWLSGACIQIFNPNFITYFGNPRLAENRGLTSFAPEPTFFGLQLIFITIVLSYFVNQTNRKKIICISMANVLGIFFLAKSAMAVLYVIVGGIIVFGFISMTSWKAFVRILIFMTIFSVFVAMVINSGALDGYRLLSLINKIVEIGPIKIITFDASINERVQHIVYAIIGSYQNFFLPNGLDTFSSEWNSSSATLTEIFWYGKPDNKIMSWLGDWVYSFGLFGFLSFIYLIDLFKFGKHKNNARLLFLITLLFSAIPIAHPLIPLILSLELAYIKGVKYEFS